jgi:hypothetical protein
VGTLIAEQPVYLLDHGWELEPHRLALLEHHADPTSGRRRIDFECGRALLSEISEAGPIDAVADLRVDVIEGATPPARWEQLPVQALSEDVLRAGTATEEQIDEHLGRLEGPDYRGYGFTWVGARGLRPSAG